MRHAVITDAHGDLEGLATALRAAAEHDVDRVLSLGDVLECRIPGRLRNRRFEDLREVTVWDPAMAEPLEGALLIRGNQEERISEHLPPDVVPSRMCPLLSGRASHRTDFATYTHGHLLSWVNHRPDLWRPTHEDFPGVALVYGHHHRNALFELSDGAAARELKITSGHPVPLDRRRRYLINVGPARGGDPSWALIDETAATVTYHFSRHRFKG